MKVLHVGWGFHPFRGGGLIEYAEDLIDLQSRKGHEIAYFFSGRKFPFRRKPVLREWVRGDVRMYEILNSPITHSGYPGSMRPQDDIHEVATEHLFTRVMQYMRPDIVHIHEVFRLCSSVIDIAKDVYRVPVIMTLHDYFMLCPTLRLFTPDGVNCLLDDVGEACMRCNSTAPRTDADFLRRTLAHEVRSRSLPLYEFFRFLASAGDWVARSSKKRSRKKKGSFPDMRRDQTVSGRPSNAVEVFQKRREINIVRLGKVDCLISQSRRVQEIYQDLAGSNNVQCMLSPPRHLESIKPRLKKPGKVLKFATLSGCASYHKGASLIPQMLTILRMRGYERRFELHVFGQCMREIRDDLRKFAGVFIHGGYEREELDTILEDTDVGIVPSVWEEPLGYVGLEFLAKGIPVIGNKRGGITDYVIDDTTGFLNANCSAEGLARIMEEIIDKQELVEQLNQQVVGSRNNFVKSFDSHVNEILSLYSSVVRQRQG